MADGPRAQAEALRRAGDFAGAARQLAIVVGLAPEDLAAWMALGYARVRAGRPTGAAEAYLRAAALLAASGHRMRALAVARRAMALDPGCATAPRLAPLARRIGAAAVGLLEQATRIQLLRRRPELARELLRLTLAADPAGLDRRWQLVQLDLAEGDWVDAVDQLRLVATGLLRQGRVADYVRAAEMALEYGGPDVSLLRELAKIYRRLGERARAHRCLTKLARVQPEDPELLEALARSHVELGDFAAGLRTLASLVELFVDGGARQAAREVLGRAERWSSDEEYTRSVDRLRVDRLVRRVVPTTPATAPATIPRSGLVVLGPLVVAADDARCGASA